MKLLLLVMRVCRSKHNHLNLITLITCLLPLSGAFSQSSTGIELEVNNASLLEIFEELEKQSGYSFALGDSLLTDNQERYSLSVQANTLPDALRKLSPQMDLRFRIEDKTVLVKPRKKELKNTVTRKISGTVTGTESSEPLIGVNIIANASGSGTSTDIQGQFEITVSGQDQYLILTYIGYERKEVPIEGSNLSISLTESQSTLEEAVVIGYGTQNKRDITTAIGTIKRDEITDQPVANFDQAMVGKLAGVQVLQTTGQPGESTTIRIRGVGSVNSGNEPLYVVDGIVMDRSSQALELVDLNDVESIEVLKDASAAAIYGSRGANGVILITTRKGKSGKPQFNYNFSYGWQQLSKKIPMLNAYQYADLARDGHNNAYLADVPTGSVDDPNELRPQGYHRIPPELFPYLEGQPGLTDTDWQDEVYQVAPIQRHSISISGGTDKTKYFISGNYLDQEGIIRNSYYKRYGARMNLESSYDKFKIGINLAPTYSNENQLSTSGPYFDDGIVHNALSSSPVWPVYNPDGSFNFQGNGYWRGGTDYQHNEILNPVAMAELLKNEIDHFNLSGKVYASYDILKNLTYQLSLGGVFNSYNQNYYHPSTLQTRGSSFYDQPSNPISRASSTYYYNWILEHTLKYNIGWEDHHLDFLGGFTAQKNYSNLRRVEATNFPNDLVETVNGGEIIGGSGNIQEWSLLSWLGRVQYQFKDRYLLSAALRTDGSSRFGEDNRYGYFPSASAGWIISSEEFMKPLTLISSMKIRGSYGQTGNFQIGNYEHISRVGPESYIFGPGDGQNANGIVPVNVGNSDLRWEKTEMFDAGLDFGLWRNRIELTIDYYNSITSDLLLNVPVPLTTGFEIARQNIGSVQNRGWEFMLTLRDRYESFSWAVSGNLSVNKNKVLSLGSQGTEIIKTAGTGHSYFITRIGEPIGSYYFLTQDGVFENQQELDEYPHFANTQPGDFRFVDIDGNDTIDVDADRSIVGSYFPDFIYGMRAEISYAGFDLAINLQGTEGNEILNLLRRYNANMEGNFNNTTEALNRWRSPEEPGNGEVNRANRKATGNNGRTSTWHLEDGSYIRIQNIALGYTLPEKWTKRVLVDRLRFYISVQNLYTWTDYSGYNPEVDLYNSDALTPGVDYGVYPLARTYSLGLNATF